MESLLRWSIENSSPLASAPSDHSPIAGKDLDPAIIDMILGKSDAELMKEDLAVAVDPSRSEDERIDALDHLEMMIEQIDNANSLDTLKMWEPLHSLLTSETTSPAVKTQALWVIGTAVQNNPAAQDAYLAQNPTSTLLSFLIPSPSSPPQLRSKAVYTLSGLLKHNAPAVSAFGGPLVDGWVVLRDSLQDPDITVRRKTIFLLGTLLAPTQLSVMSSSYASSPTIHANSHSPHLHDPSRTDTSKLTLDAVRIHGISNAIISALINPLPQGEDGGVLEADLDFEEKGLRWLHTYAFCCREDLPDSEKEALRGWVEKEKAREGETKMVERWSLDVSELRELTAKLE